jgi:tRNA modification GTPase
MTPHPDDTIVALASAPGPGARGIVRLSGPRTREVVAALFDQVPDASVTKRSLRSGALRIPGVHSPLPADLYFAPAPRTYTGQDTAELHTVSSPPLLEALIAALLSVGARPARPGEFTLRAFLAGKKDLPQAEAVAAVVEAGTPDELRQALAQLAGGVTLPLHGLREDLLNLLADVEAGLDFTDEDIEFVGKKDILLRLGKGLAQLMNLGKQLGTRAVSGRPFRVALVGAPNAGKSSLFNALAGRPAAIVGPAPGTTRDYLTHTLRLGDLAVELIDTAGRQEAGDTIEEQAQALGRDQAAAADLLLLCFDATGPAPAPVEELAGRPAARVATKCDLAPAPPGAIATSAARGDGLNELKGLIAEHARAFARPALAPSLSRCRHHVEECLKHLRAAHAIVLFDDPAELLALELRLALEQLGEMVGAVYTDDLLDRVFSRFCIGK